MNIIIKKADFVKSAVSIDGLPNTGLSEFAFIGRSNVGKSSLLNMLLQRKSLVKTSKKPGKTAALNYFEIASSFKEGDVESLNNFYMVDLPGYGFARRSQIEQIGWRETIEPYLQTRLELKNIFLLIDSRHGIQDNDADMIDFLKYYGRNFTLVYTKTDKISKTEMGRLKSISREALFVSSVAKTGREDVWSLIKSCL